MTPPPKPSIRRFSSKEEEAEYWMSRPAHERLAEGWRLTLEAYGLKVAPRLQKTLRRIKCRYLED